MLITAAGDIDFDAFDTQLVKKGDPLPDTLKLDDANLTKTKVFNYSIPKMTINLTQQGDASTQNILEADSKSTALMSKSTSHLKNTAISPIKKRPKSSSGKHQHISTAKSLDEQISMRKSKVLDKLKTSPFLPNEHGFVPGKSSKSLPNKKSSSSSKSFQDEETAIKKEKTDWALRLEVSAVMGGKISSGANDIYKRELDASMEKREAEKKGVVLTKKMLEAQGPIDWSSTGLKYKYRNEDNRESAWSAYMEAKSFAENTAYDTNKEVIPLAVVERHPLVTMFFKRLTWENVLSRERTLARLRMKRFVQDVREVWLTNLEHLREHQPENMYDSQRERVDSNSGSASEGPTSMKQQGLQSETRHSTDGSTIINHGDQQDKGNYASRKRYSSYMRGNGLRDRRDTAAIAEMQSQIQSVSHDRALKNSFYTTRMPEPAVKLDYVAKPCPQFDPSANLPPPPLLQSLLLWRGSAVTTHPSEHGLVLCIDRLVPPVGASAATHSYNPETTVSTSGMSQSQSQSVSEDAATLTAQKTAAEEGRHTAALVQWRIALYRTNANIAMKTYVVSELEVLQFLKDLGDHCESSQSGGEGADEERSGDTLLQRIPSLHIPWASGMELNVGLTVSLREKSAYSLTILSPTTHPDNNVEIVVETVLQDEYEGFETEPLIADPVEMLTMLGIKGVPPLTSSLKKYFIESLQPEDSNHYIWERLTSYLHFREGDEDSEGDPLPRRLGLTPFEPDQVGDHLVALVEQERMDREQNGLQRNRLRAVEVTPTAKATSDAYLLISLLTISDDLDIEVVPYPEPELEPHEDITDFCPLPLLEVNDHFVFEELSDVVNSLSLRVSGGQALLRQVPGACPVGSMGLWFHYPHHRERTQACANFFRNAQISSTDTVLVNLTLALDTVILNLPALAWDPANENPPKTIHDPIDGIIPQVTAHPTTLLNKPVRSVLETRTTPVIRVFNTAPAETFDYPFLEPIINRTKFCPAGLTRHYPFRNENGFRNKIVENLISVDPVLPTTVFGVTRMGATPNASAMHTRSVWHAITTVTESINRMRGSKDYHYVLANDLSHGPNDPACFTLRFVGYGDRETFSAEVISSAFALMEQQYIDIQDERARFKRENALDDKIEASEIALRTKKKEFEMKLRKQTQLAIEKRMRKTAKTEAGWRQKMQGSIVQSIQGQWEQRLDQRTGTCFFHRIVAGDELSGVEDTVEKEECYMDTCQWEVPITWVGDPLATAKDHEKSQFSDVNKSTKGNDPLLKVLGAGDSAFSQPNEVWLPYEKELLSEDFKTPGVQTKGWVRSGNGQGADRIGVGGPLLNCASSLASIREESAKHGVKAMLANPSKNLVRNDVEDEEEDSVTDQQATVSSNIEASNGQGNTLAEELLLNDDIVYALAKRLGLPTDQIVAANNLPSIFTAGTTIATPTRTAGGSLYSAFQRQPSVSFSHELKNKDGSLNAPRFDSRDPDVHNMEDSQFDSDDDVWSDDEAQVGNIEGDGMEEGALRLPQSHKEKKAMLDEARRLENTMGLDMGDEKNQKNSSQVQGSKGMVHIPYMNFADNPDLPLVGQAHEDNKTVMAWRKLPRPDIPQKFFDKCTKTTTMGAEGSEVSNKPNNPIFLNPLAPVDACKYIPEVFSVDVESIFIPDCRADMDRVLGTIERNIKKEEELSKNLPTDDLLLFGKTKETTSVDEFVAKQYRNDKASLKDPREEAIEKAILAAKTSSISEMEDALEEDIGIDITDQFGNSLLVLAAQQGSKRMCKYLLRRGASINWQNLQGNTALHYAFAYKNEDLAAYLKLRGADDSILNAQQLTCYEGLSRDSLEYL